ncbi:helix-turn-helix domain-containing protein [Streptomyces sp. NPDC051546]|uniref:helix-turn-helix domain-containing protein n=1 Tax=Streptomyces sp. NPDC051546 TaxID=3365655 RepID=UPI0037955361
MRIRRERLRELRTRRQMTQDDLASVLDISRAAVSTWETTGRFPRPATMRRLALCLGVPAFDLIEADVLTLRVLRMVSGMRQRDIALLLGVVPTTYCDVERGRRTLPQHWIPVLSKAFGVPPRNIRNLSEHHPKKDGGDTGI